MGRKSKPWPRKGRRGFWTKIKGQFVKLADTEREAWVELHRLSGTASVETNITLARLMDLWIADRKKAVEPTTWESYRKYAQSLTDRWGRAQARDIREHHIDKWMDAHSGWKGCRTLAQRIAKMAFKWGRRKGYLEANPLADMPGHGTAARKPPPKGGIARIAGGIRMDEFADLWGFMVATGVRPGEASSLEAERIDLESMAAVVKGKKGFRLVILTEESAAPLRRALKRHPDGLVFRNTKGEQWSPGALSEQVRRARARSGAGEVVAYHARGNFASEAHRAGADAATIATALGHKDTVRLRILLTNYLQVDEETIRKAYEDIAAARAGRAETPPRRDIPPRKRPGPPGQP